METASDIINDALQELIIQAIEQPIEAVDFNIAKRYMNRFMAELKSDGVDLGYTSVTSPSDIITIDDGAINGLIANLAFHLSVTYDVSVSPELAIKAKNGLRVMTKIGVTVGETSYPDTLPIGSGNESDFTDGNHFYEEPDTPPTV